MGWAIIVAIKPLAASVPLSALKLIVAGGLSYTVGIVFYLWRRLPYHHAIWHLFVLSGSVQHYFAVFCDEPCPRLIMHTKTTISKDTHLNTLPFIPSRLRTQADSPRRKGGDIIKSPLP